MAGKPIRLGKAAGELNVGMSTLVEFLGSKGIKIDVSPNTKLEEEHYDILRKEFAADQSLKEQSKFSAVKREKRESVSIRDKEEETTHAPQVEEEDSEPISAEEIKRNIIMETPVAKVEEPVVEEPKVEEEPEQKTVSSGDVHVSVIGKIDLDRINSKTRPDKKKHEENKPKPVAQAPVEAVKPVVEKVEEVKAPVVEAKVETPEPEGPKEIETIRVERKVLTGPTVLGRIELPVERPKTPNQKSAAGQAAADAPGPTWEEQQMDGTNPKLFSIDPG